MSTALVLNSSALGETSVSNQLVNDTLDALRARDPGLQVVLRDLGRDPLPHLLADSVFVIRGGAPQNERQSAALALSDALIAELRAADVIVIGAPMYNFGMPSTLKAWFDHVVRAGETFRYGESGPVGLVQGKRAIVIETRGGLYSEGPWQPMDSQEPHLRNLLGFIGIADVSFVRAEKLGFGPEARDAAMGAARSRLGEVVEAGSLRAA
jgi:FMN-dependent NADH-azoreductase